MALCQGRFFADVVMVCWQPQYIRMRRIQYLGRLLSTRPASPRFGILGVTWSHIRAERKGIFALAVGGNGQWEVHRSSTHFDCFCFIRCQETGLLQARWWLTFDSPGFFVESASYVTKQPVFNKLVPLVPLRRPSSSLRTMWGSAWRGRFRVFRAPERFFWLCSNEYRVHD